MRVRMASYFVPRASDPPDQIGDGLRNLADYKKRAFRFVPRQECKIAFGHGGNPRGGVLTIAALTIAAGIAGTFHVDAKDEWDAGCGRCHASPILSEIGTVGRRAMSNPIAASSS